MKVQCNSLILRISLELQDQSLRGYITILTNERHDLPNVLTCILTARPALAIINNLSFTAHYYYGATEMLLTLVYSAILAGTSASVVTSIAKPEDQTCASLSQPALCTGEVILSGTPTTLTYICPRKATQTVLVTVTRTSTFVVTASVCATSVHEIVHPGPPLPAETSIESTTTVTIAHTSLLTRTITVNKPQRTLAVDIVSSVPVSAVTDAIQTIRPPVVTLPIRSSAAIATANTTTTTGTCNGTTSSLPTVFHTATPIFFNTTSLPNPTASRSGGFGWPTRNVTTKSSAPHFRPTNTTSTITMSSTVSGTVLKSVVVSHIWDEPYPTSVRNNKTTTSTTGTIPSSTSCTVSTIVLLTKILPIPSNISRPTSTYSYSYHVIVSGLPVYGNSARNAPPTTAFAPGAQTVVPGSGNGGGNKSNDATNLLIRVRGPGASSATSAIVSFAGALFLIVAVVVCDTFI
ncbi:hypothetical protein B0J11DRAFT_588876 [Dendryphion nanum]|uniref:Uncharacterized protein n=1 Tax=Dendryphion nanum TaxID=256645 RepID=A0A9P9ELC5_9PLEO|nr:hypothetical protein B0J11DRAFT_588876 [Dendryphion nanum]